MQDEPKRVLFHTWGGAVDIPRLVEQLIPAIIMGGIVMGLGMALMEETQFDERKGRIMNPSLSDYHMPVHADVPEIEVMWTDILDPHTPMEERPGSG